MDVPQKGHNRTGSHTGLTPPSDTPLSTKYLRKPIDVPTGSSPNNYAAREQSTSVSSNYAYSVRPLSNSYTSQSYEDRYRGFSYGGGKGPYSFGYPANPGASSSPIASPRSAEPRETPVGYNGSRGSVSRPHSTALDRVRQDEYGHHVPSSKKDHTSPLIPNLDASVSNVGNAMQVHDEKLTIKRLARMMFRFETILFVLLYVACSFAFFTFIPEQLEDEYALSSFDSRLITASRIWYSSFKLIPKPQNDTAEVVQYFVFEGIEPPVAQEPTYRMLLYNISVEPKCSSYFYFHLLSPTTLNPIDESHEGSLQYGRTGELAGIIGSVDDSPVGDLRISIQHDDDYFFILENANSMKRAEGYFNFWVLPRTYIVDDEANGIVAIKKGNGSVIFPISFSLETYIVVKPPPRKKMLSIESFGGGSLTNGSLGGSNFIPRHIDGPKNKELYIFTTIYYIRWSFILSLFAAMLVVLSCFVACYARWRIRRKRDQDVYVRI